ncbi:MAG: FimV/HubP family polar landmark protein [Gammaproteobacteria bacterium]|nr:FimV/HubP family polar landmark protein [Gammaproteobacteria bacterium]
MLPGISYALGLGAIQSESTLDQQLKAKIQILGARDLDIQGMEIKLANDAIYKRMGVERNPVVKDLRFSISQNAEGQYFIDVSSANVISEPFVNFLIEVDWNAGRLLREFTILLDPPVVLEEEAPEVEKPEAELPPSFTVTTSEQAEKTHAPDSSVVTEVPAEDENEPANLGDLMAGQEMAPEPEATEQMAEPETSELEEGSAASKPLVYEVQKNDYLWNIAESMRPADVSVEQMMLALQRENPQAFFGSTVSQLKEGAILRLENISATQELSKEDAIIEIAKQHQDWLSYRKARQARNAVAVESTNVDLEGLTSAPSSGASQVTSGARLELVTPIEEQQDEVRAQSNIALEAATEERITQLNMELALSNETLEAAKRENVDLLNRLGAMEEQMSAMQSLVQLKDSELQRMQSGNETEASSSSIEPIVSLNMDHTHEEKQPVAVQKAVHSGKVETLLKSLLEDPVTIVVLIFIGIFISVIAWLLTRKGIEKHNEELEEKSIEELFPEYDSEQRTVITERATFPEEESQISLEPLTEFGEETEFVPQSEKTKDLIAQADVYLSYNKFDKAEALLRDAIDNEPERQDYKLKLLETYARKQDVDAFNNQADILYAAINGDTDSKLWADASEFATEVGSDNPLFAIKSAEQPESKKPEISQVDTTEWKPETVTEIAEQDIVAPSTEFHADEPSTVINEAIPINNVETQQTDSSKSKPLVSDEELEKAMASFSDEAIQEEQTEIIEEPSSALSQMLDNLQKPARKNTEQIKSAADNKAPQENNVFEESSLFLLSDEVGTKLDLARAYIEMGDQEGARDLLSEVLDEGDSRQKDEAKELMEMV